MVQFGVGGPDHLIAGFADADAQIDVVEGNRKVDGVEAADRFAAEVRYMQKRWGDVLRSDPYYNPNLSLDATDFSLAGTPRVTRPWQARSSGNNSAPLLKDQ